MSNEEIRAKILEIHSKKHYNNKKDNFIKFVRMVDDFNGAILET